MFKFLRSWLIFQLIFLQLSYANAQDEIGITSYLIGETQVSVYEECYQPCNSDNIVFINVHDNEKTSVNAAVKYLKVNGGSLVYIYNNGQRNVSFSLYDSTYNFDPNRIYSQKGRIETITLNSTGFKKMAEKQVSTFANSFLRNYINDKVLIVAFHNNTDSNFSILSYKQQVDSLPLTGKYFINANMDIDDFIITNSQEVFDSLQSRRINVALENWKAMEDDGSLSIYTGKKKIHYINIEAENDHLQEQQMMLQALDVIIKKYSVKKIKLKKVLRKVR